MPDDLFQPRTGPSDRHEPLEPWPAESQPGEDLLTPFDVIRRALDARRAADAACEPPAPADETPPAPPAHGATHRGALAENRDPSRRWRLIAAAAIAASLAAATAGTLAYTGGSGAATRAGAADPAEPAAPTPDSASAAQWIIRAIGPDHVVACDVSVCAYLRAHGFPAASARTVRTGVAEIEQADVVVMSGLIRAQFGAALEAVVSAQPLATFGTGADRVDIAPVALDGTAAYGAALAEDLALRRTVGAELLANRRLTIAAAARPQLSAGLVDTRLCALLALLAGTHTVTVTAFTAPGPGAGPDIPAPGAVISLIDGQQATVTAAPAAAARALVRAQRTPYAPMSAVFTSEGLRVLFTQPPLLGLLGGTG